MEGDNTGTKADRSHADGVLHAKEGLGWGGGAHRELCSVGERGDLEGPGEPAGEARGSLVFGGCAFPPVSLGPAGDCPCKD